MMMIQDHSLALASPLLLSGGVWDILARTSLFGAIILSILVLMSLISWGIIIHKYRQFKEVNAQSDKFGGAFTHSKDLGELMSQSKAFRHTPLTVIYSAGLRETDSLLQAKGTRGADTGNAPPLGDHDFSTISMILDKTASEELGKLERHVVFLATTANAAPFLGLLGTVVGVMDSFWSIGERGSASLTVVAPGIAEALLATIVGLAAAIPAVIGYNWANNKMKYLTSRVNNFNLEFLSRLKKENYQ